MVTAGYLGRLIQQQHFPACGERPRDRQLLLLPTGKMPPRRSFISSNTGNSS